MEKEYDRGCKICGCRDCRLEPAVWTSVVSPPVHNLKILRKHVHCNNRVRRRVAGLLCSVCRKQVKTL